MHLLSHILGLMEVFPFPFAALCGVVMYNYIKIKDVRASQTPSESIPERITKVSLLHVDIL